MAPQQPDLRHLRLLAGSDFLVTSFLSRENVPGAIPLYLLGQQVVDPCCWNDAFRLSMQSADTFGGHKCSLQIPLGGTSAVGVSLSSNRRRSHKLNSSCLSWGMFSINSWSSTDLVRTASKSAFPKTSALCQSHEGHAASQQSRSSSASVTDTARECLQNPCRFLLGSRQLSRCPPVGIVCYLLSPATTTTCCCHTS